MSAIIIGGNECMGRTYCDLCAKYNMEMSSFVQSENTQKSVRYWY